MKKPVSKGKRSHNAAYPKQEKLVRPPGRASSSSDQGRELNNLASSTILIPANQVNLPTKVRSKRKIDSQKVVMEKDIKSEDIVNGKSNVPSPCHEKSLNLKVKHLYFLTSPPVYTSYIVFHF